MRFISFLFSLFFCASRLVAQSNDIVYSKLISKADSLYYAKEYLKSAQTFNYAFLMNNDMGLVKDRYNAACSWALSNYADSAFSQLFRIVDKGNFKDDVNLLGDPDLKSLQTDSRWKLLLQKVIANKVDN